MRKRLNFGLEITSGRLPVTNLPKEVSVNFSKVGVFLLIVLDSIETMSEIVEAIDNLSGGNVRLALEFIRRLVGSGHIDTRKILEIYQKTGRYYIRLHEVLRTVIFGDCVYYDPNTSPLENLFDTYGLDPTEHFLGLTLLQFVASEGRRSREHGFVETGKIYNFCNSLGFYGHQIDLCLEKYCRRHLLETAGRIRPINGTVSTHAVRITTIGAYHLERLPSMFVYYDAIVTDTPILEKEYRERIYDVSDIEDRLIRGEVFLEYLDSCFRKLGDLQCGVQWSRYLSETRNNIKEIRSYIRN